MTLAKKRQKPTPTETMALNEARLGALDKAAEAAKGAGVENLESVETELHATKKAIEDYEPLDIMRPQSSAVQAEGMALREKQRSLTEARFWFKKAMIIQALMETKIEKVL